MTPKAAAAALARTQAIAEIANMVRTEAYVMAYSDCFSVMGIALIVAALALFLVPKAADRRGCPTVMAPSTGLTSLSARHSSR